MLNYVCEVDKNVFISNENRKFYHRYRQHKKEIKGNVRTKINI